MTFSDGRDRFSSLPLETLVNICLRVEDPGNLFVTYRALWHIGKSTSFRSSWVLARLPTWLDILTCPDFERFSEYSGCEAVRSSRYGRLLTLLRDEVLLQLIRRWDAGVHPSTDGEAGGAIRQARNRLLRFAAATGCSRTVRTLFTSTVCTLSAADNGYAALFAFARHQLDAARLLLRDRSAEIPRVEDAFYCVATATDPGWASMLEPVCSAITNSERAELLARTVEWRIAQHYSYHPGNNRIIPMFDAILAETFRLWCSAFPSKTPRIRDLPIPFSDLPEQALLAVLCTALSARPPFLTLHDAFLKYDLAEIIIMRDLHSCLQFLCAQPSFEVCYDNNWLLRLACARGSLLCTKVLLQHGADPSVAGGLILRDCAAAGNENVLELLLNATTPLAVPSKKLYINIASIPREALNSSLISAVQNNHPRAALLLLRHGADVGAGDEMPIRIAIARGYVTLVELLVAAGADICRVLGVGKSVMDVVASGWITRWDKWSR
ncbi:hypothetical protein HDU85_004831 [Gaertneriomyces sp. JEL0708]|nr:hypothetical protein HDU85_004831 [Gaertneriomyces sp. JEL0708]